MLPAQISAMPAYITVSVWPRLDKPAVRAKGTVRPSAKPRVKSARKRERVGLLSHVVAVAWMAWRCAGVRKSEEVSEKAGLSVEEARDPDEVSNVSALRGE